jgi:hypothetical protein
MSSENDIINNGVIDYGICCDVCGYEIEDNVTGYWRDGVTGVWSDVRYCGICVFDFVKQPKRNTAEQIWRRQEEARKEQERLRVPESERRRLREEREERERQSRREYEEEIEEYRAWREQQKPERNPALNNILAKQESARLQERERLRDEEKERESMDEEDNDVTSTRLYTGPEEHDPRFDYDSLIDDSDWLQAHANTATTPVHCNGEHSRSYDWDTKPPIEEYDWIQTIENRKNSHLPGTVEDLYKSFDSYDDHDEYNWSRDEEEEMPLRNMNDVQIERYVELIGRCPRDECDEWAMVYNGGDILRYSYCKFIQWHIEDQTVSNITITRAIFDEITFTNYVFDNVTFEECVFKDIILNNTTFKNSKFIECQLDSSIVPDKSCEIVNYFDSDDDN